MSRTSKLAVGCAIVVAIVVAAMCLPVGDALEAFVEWVRDLGALGVVVYSLVPRRASQAWPVQPDPP